MGRIETVMPRTTYLVVVVLQTLLSLQAQNSVGSSPKGSAEGDAASAEISRDELASHGFKFDNQERPMCELGGSDGTCHVEAFVWGEKPPSDAAAYTCTKLDKASYVGHCVRGNLEGVSLVIADGTTKEGKEAFISYFVGGRIAYPALSSYLIGDLNFGVHEINYGYGCVYFGKWDQSAKRCNRFAQIYGADIFTESNAKKLRDGTFDLSQYRSKFFDFVHRDDGQPKR